MVWGTGQAGLLMEISSFRKKSSKEAEVFLILRGSGKGKEFKMSLWKKRGMTS